MWVHMMLFRAEFHLNQMNLDRLMEPDTHTKLCVQMCTFYTNTNFLFRLNDCRGIFLISINFKQNFFQTGTKAEEKTAHRFLYVQCLCLVHVWLFFLNIKSFYIHFTFLSVHNFSIWLSKKPIISGISKNQQEWEMEKCVANAPKLVNSNRTNHENRMN